jgi:hypothetical protein
VLSGLYVIGRNVCSSLMLSRDLRVPGHIKVKSEISGFPSPIAGMVPETVGP